MRQDHAVHAATADEAVVPAKIMIQHHVKLDGLAGFQRRERAGLHLGFEATTTERANNFSVGEENGLGAGALGTGTFGAGNQRERERLVRGGGELFVDAGHGEVLARRRGRFNGNFG